MVSVQQESRHLLFGDVDIKWMWRPAELQKFYELWNAGEPIQKIARAFYSNRMSIALLVVDQAECGNISQRRGGLEGGWSVDD